MGLVTIAAGNGANSGRTVPLVGTEIHTVEIGDSVLDLEVGVVDVDGVRRWYGLSDLVPADEACPKTGRSAAVCDRPDHRDCPDLRPPGA